MQLEEYLLSSGIATSAQITDALERQRSSRPPLGELAVCEGVMRSRDVEAVLAWQRFDRMRPFGEIAVDLAFITSGQLERLLRLQGLATLPLLDVLASMGVTPRDGVGRVERDFLWARWEKATTLER